MIPKSVMWGCNIHFITQTTTTKTKAFDTDQVGLIYLRITVLNLSPYFAKLLIHFINICGGQWHKISRGQLYIIQRTINASSFDVWRRDPMGSVDLDAVSILDHVECIAEFLFDRRCPSGGRDLYRAAVCGD